MISKFVLRISVRSLHVPFFRRFFQVPPQPFAQEIEKVGNQKAACHARLSLGAGPLSGNEIDEHAT